jgi:hypothetical protein
MTGGLRFLSRDGFVLLALATRDSERRPEVGECVPRTELSVRLVQVETDDRQKGDAAIVARMATATGPVPRPPFNHA